MSVHQPLHEKVSVSQLKPRWGQLPGCGEPSRAESLPRRGWRSRGAYPEEHTLKRGVSAATPLLSIARFKSLFLIALSVSNQKKASYSVAAHCIFWNPSILVPLRCLIFMVFNVCADMPLCTFTVCKAICWWLLFPAYLLNLFLAYCELASCRCLAAAWKWKFVSHS